MKKNDWGLHFVSEVKGFILFFDEKWIVLEVRTHLGKHFSLWKAIDAMPGISPFPFQLPLNLYLPSTNLHQQRTPSARNRNQHLAQTFTDS